MKNIELKLTYRQIADELSKNNLLVRSCLKNPDGIINYISYNSRKLNPDTLFFCKGAFGAFKEEYLTEAVSKGAVCYVSENKFDADGNADYFIVNNIRRAVAVLSSLYYNRPCEKLNLTGITGTKGKTTVSYFLKNIFDEYAGYQTGFTSTIQIYTGKRNEAATLSTPESCDLHEYLYEAEQNGLEYFTIEVSSQAYNFNFERMYGMHFDNGIFLNISEDHISPLEHKDFDDYLNCKLQFIKNCSNVVVNAETDYLHKVLEAAEDADSITLYGTERSKATCDYYSYDIRSIGNLIYFYAKSDKYDYFEEFAIKMRGLFNVENALATISMAKTMGIDDESIRRGLLKSEVPGRMSIFENNGVTVIVDYAHNYLSFEKLFESIKKDYDGRRIISVGGTPGGRALRRRRDFANIVGGGSDYVYLTADDPYHEDVLEICREIAGSMNGTPYEIIADRKEAVTKAIQGAKRGDVIVLLAKGAEIYQKIGGKLVPYESDLTIAKNLLFDNIHALS